MIREVNLVSYLPPFMQEFKEVSAALNAENPEFTLVWSSADRVLKNQFIETADEYGLSRFEKILKILPSKEDTLESRRSRVQNRWFNDMPYTMHTLISKLSALCADRGFAIVKYFTEDYKLEIQTDLEAFGQVEELERIIEGVIPCNLVVKSTNYITLGAVGSASMGGTVVQNQNFVVNTELNTQQSVETRMVYTSVISEHKTINI